MGPNPLDLLGATDFHSEGQDPREVPQDPIMAELIQLEAEYDLAADRQREIDHALREIFRELPDEIREPTDVTQSKEDVGRACVSLSQTLDKLLDPTARTREYYRKLLATATTHINQWMWFERKLSNPPQPLASAPKASSGEAEMKAHDTRGIGSLPSPGNWVAGRQGSKIKTRRTRRQAIDAEQTLAILFLQCAANKLPLEALREAYERGAVISEEYPELQEKLEKRIFARPTRKIPAHQPFKVKVYSKKPKPETEGGPKKESVGKANRKQKRRDAGY